MSNTYRDKPHKHKKQIRDISASPKPEKKEREIWVGEQAVVEKHFLKMTRLLRNEERADDERFKADVLDRLPDEQERRGKALFRLELVETHFSPSGQKLLSFALKNGRPLPRYTLMPGDVVILSGFQTPLVDCPSGTVYEKDRMKIIIAFNRAIPSWVESEKTFRVSLSANKNTYERMYETIHVVNTAEHSTLSNVRDISLGLKKPTLLDAVSQSVLNGFDARLNAEQNEAVRGALEAKEIFLIHGPPGTGKTRVLVEIVRQAVLQNQSVLLSAPSNAACDHLVECLVAAKIPVTRLGHPARVTERIREHTLSYKLSAHPLAKMIDQNEFALEQIERQKERRQDRRVMSWEERREMRDEIHRLRDDTRELKTQIFKQVWNASDVVVATHIGCGDSLIRAKAFDWVILDEATQGIEPATWIPMRHGGKIVLAGDHEQLPPTVFSHRANERDLSFTLFERLTAVLPKGFKIRLERQYRMNEKIMRFSSDEFYDGMLLADETARGITLKDLCPAILEADNDSVIWLDTAGMGYEEEIEVGTESRYNSQEAKLVVQELNRLLANGVKAKDIAVISPYSAQVKLLTSLILGDREDLGDLAELEIDSVDAFQGREKEAVLVSLVRSNADGDLGFLKDIRRMNVAMTRAKRKLIFVGDSATLSAEGFYERFVGYVESINGYRSAWSS